MSVWKKPVSLSFITSKTQNPSSPFGGFDFLAPPSPSLVRSPLTPVQQILRKPSTPGSAKRKSTFSELGDAGNGEYGPAPKLFAVDTTASPNVLSDGYFLAADVVQEDGWSQSTTTVIEESDWDDSLVPSGCKLPSLNEFIAPPTPPMTPTTPSTPSGCFRKIKTRRTPSSSLRNSTPAAYSELWNQFSISNALPKEQLPMESRSWDFSLKSNSN